MIEKFEAEAQPKPNAQLALMLLLYTGQRASDVVRMRWSDYDGEGIAGSPTKDRNTALDTVSFEI